MLYPTVYNIYLSLWEWRYTSPGSAKFIGLENYYNVFLNDPTFWQVLRFTLLFTAVTIGLEFLLGIGSALIFNNMKKGKRVAASLFLIPYSVAPIAVGLTWRLLWMNDYGLVNFFLKLIGLGTVDWLTNPVASFFAVIIPEVWRSTPFVTMILMAGLASIPEELYEAADVDGCTVWNKFKSITFPLIVPSLTIALMFQTIFKLRVFDLVITLTGGGPGTATLPIGVLIYRTCFRYLNGGYAATLSVILLLLGVIFSMLYIKLMSRKDV